MLVRLAFSVMLQADADVLLIDEVLAVGDAAFQQKCADAFHAMKKAGKTIVLVTHEMETVEDYCHRAMLISDGLIQRIGDPGEIGREYLRLNFERESAAATAAIEGDEVRVLDARIEALDGSRVEQIEHGEPIRIALELEVLRELPGLDVGFLVANADGFPVFNFGIPVGETEHRREVAAGERVSVRAELQNSLVAGRYFIHCGINRAFEGGIALYVQNAIEFLVFGGPHTRGAVHPDVRIMADVERGGQQ
jgi:ABC-type glutathione transport system ATPase component